MDHCLLALAELFREQVSPLGQQDADHQGGVPGDVGRVGFVLGRRIAPQDVAEFGFPLITVPMLHLADDVGHHAFEEHVQGIADAIAVAFGHRWRGGGSAGTGD